MITRRRFTAEVLRASTAILTAPALVRGASGPQAPAILRGDGPRIPNGVASGDVTEASGVVWARADRPARMIVEWALDERFRDVRTVEGPTVDGRTDFTGKVRLTNLPAGERIFYRVRFEGRDAGRPRGEMVQGRLRTAPHEPRDVFFAWSGDTCGQGFGIDPNHGGLLTYDSIRKLEPDFLVQSGDRIYADQPLTESFTLPDGTVWRNVLSEEKRVVAETLAGFRGNYRYNLLDPHVRACNAEVPFFAQWDDHEVRNNWYPGQVLTADPRYREKNVNLLAARARRAFFEYTPIDPAARSIHRSISRGPLCELFFLDMRGHRAPNGANRQPQADADTALLGDSQVEWLQDALRRSRALWKVICADMPLGLLVRDGPAAWDAVANGHHGPPLGRELEIARLLAFLKRERIRNIFWLTADVHYAAAHHYSPERAAFPDFDPFWEFVSGPLHAGTYGPTPLDGTFGPRAVWSARRPGAPAGLPPSANEQFFGTVRIAAETGAATITQYNRLGERLWSMTLEPERA